jgi:SMC interacting uncharacterized protein involved in chromosome segregation
MSDDLVKRLLDAHVFDGDPLHKEAADRIEALQAAHEAADRIDELEKKVRDMQEDVDLLNALMEAGVDNWSGYDEAIDILEGKDE